VFSSTMSTLENASHTVSRFSQVTLKIRRFQLSANCRQLAIPQHRCKRSSFWISTASEQHKDSCVCGAVGTRSALEALRLYLGCMRLCDRHLHYIILHYITQFTAARPRVACGKLCNSCSHMVWPVDQSPSFRIFHSSFYFPNSTFCSSALYP